MATYTITSASSTDEVFIHWNTAMHDTTSTGDAWQTWQAGSTTYTANTTSSNDVVWSGWNLVSEERDPVQAVTWYTWVSNDGDTVRQSIDDLQRHNQQYMPPPETEEERAARVARAETNRRAREEREAKRKAEMEAAKKKAEACLRQHLSPAQLKQYDAHKHFDVKIESRHYRIHKGWAGNVLLMDGKKCVRSFCIHPRITVPAQDNMLAQKLLLETNEAEFLRIANGVNHPAGYTYREW